VNVGEAVLQARVVGEAEDAPFAATHNTQRRHLIEPTLGSWYALQTVRKWPER